MINPLGNPKPLFSENIKNRFAANWCCKMIVQSIQNKNKINKNKNLPLAQICLFSVQKTIN